MSYKTTDSFFNAQLDAAGQYVVIVVVTTTEGAHVFHRGDVTATNLPPAPVIHISQSVLDISEMTETFIPDNVDMFANYTQTERPDCVVTLAEDDNFFANYLQGDTFLDAALAVKCGYASLAYADLHDIFSGRVESEELSAATLVLQGVME